MPGSLSSVSLPPPTVLKCVEKLTSSQKRRLKQKKAKEREKSLGASTVTPAAPANKRKAVDVANSPSVKKQKILQPSGGRPPAAPSTSSLPPVPNPGSSFPATSSHPASFVEADCAETPLSAYRAVVPFLSCLISNLRSSPSLLRLYDPYYCTGMVKENLAKLGFTTVYVSASGLRALPFSSARRVSRS